MLMLHLLKISGSSSKHRSQLSERRECATVSICEEIELGDNIGNEEKTHVKISRSLSQRPEHRFRQRVSQGDSVALAENFYVEVD